MIPRGHDIGVMKFGRLSPIVALMMEERWGEQAALIDKVMHVDYKHGVRKKKK